MDLKSLVGQKSAVHSYRATEERIRAFCQAVHARYRDAAPPTFMTVLRAGEFDLLERMGVALSSVLHADQEFRYLRPILPGDELEFQASLARATEKSSGGALMRFLVLETEVAALRADERVAVGTSKTTIISRPGGGASK